MGRDLYEAFTKGWGAPRILRAMNHRLSTSVVVLALAVGLFGPAARAQSFTIIGLPDTQFYSESYPAIFAQQTQWVAAQASALAIRYVSHYGDVVQNGDDLQQWMNADVALANLDASGIPYGVTAGNHDITPSGISGSAYIPANFLAYCGASRFDNQSYYRGDSPSGMSSYQVFEGGGLAWLALHVECDAAIAELEWAQGVLDRHRDKPVVFTTHRYLQDAEDYTAGVPVVPSGRYPAIWYAIEGPYTPGGIQSEEIFDWFVRRNPNILLVNCGHFHEEYRQTSTNVFGYPVHEVLADYQDDPNGGNGWLRIMTFDLGQNEIFFESYSPYLDQVRTADESLFVLPVNFSDYYETNRTTVLQQGINGYAGTQDTWLSEADPNSAFGQNGVRVVDDDVMNSFFGDDQGQGLVRFDGLFGAPGQGAIPSGAQIVSAHLTIQLSDDIDNPLFDPDFYVHQVQTFWDENSTWNSLGGGLSGTEIGPLLATFRGDNNPDSDGIRRLDVTAAVQAWSNGAPNYGFAILPEIISGNDDGIEILTSESSNALLRPRLEVVWVGACGYTSYGQVATPAHTIHLEGLGQPVLGGGVELSAEQVPGNQVIYAYSLAPAQIPLAGGVLLLDPQWLSEPFAVPAANGRASWPFPLPDLPELQGIEVCFQAIAPDPLQAQGIAFSNGVKAKLCR